MNTENFDKCTTILLDVAGTVGTINFLKDSLLPYALKLVEDYLKSNWDADNVKEIIAEWKGEDAEYDVAKAVAKYTKLTEENADDKTLKTLQGLLYKKGYESGEIKAHVFDDVKESIENWSKNRKICIYSTGSEEAQKLYFANTIEGDLSKFIMKYFDLSIGVKTEAESYKAIAKELSIEPEEILFLSDNLDEIKASKAAGCIGVFVNRENVDAGDQLVIKSFADLPIPAKRKSEEEGVEAPPTKVAKTETETEKKPEETPAAEKVESMEVDSSEKPEKETPASQPEKMDEAPVDNKESIEPESKVVEETKEPIVEEPKTEEETKSEEIAKEKITEEVKITEVTEEVTETVDGAKTTVTETTVVVEETKTSTVEGTTTKTESEVVIEEVTTIVEEKVEETPKAVEKDAKVDDEKTEEKVVVETTTKTVEEKLVENGKTETEVTKDNETVAKTEANGTEEEKENKSEIANGGGTEKNGDSTTSKNGDVVKDDEEKKDDEIKVKKIEEAKEATPVTVEA